MITILQICLTLLKGIQANCPCDILWWWIQCCKWKYFLYSLLNILPMKLLWIFPTFAHACLYPHLGRVKTKKQNLFWSCSSPCILRKFHICKQAFSQPLNLPLTIPELLYIQLINGTCAMLVSQTINQTASLGLNFKKEHFFPLWPWPDKTSKRNL